MKKNRINYIALTLVISGVLVIAITLLLVLTKEHQINGTLRSILYEIDKALILTTIFGTITKIISDELISVRKNDKKMRELGIHSIGEGRLDKKQANIMFGGRGYEYPDELKFFFINGRKFLSKYKSNIIDAIKYGCKIKILIADPIKSVDFLRRANKINNQNSIEGVLEAIKIVESINKELEGKGFKGTIELRHFIDEYRYNFRLAKFYSEHQVIKAWINFQPMNRIAVDQSLTVIGSYDIDYLKEAKSNVDKERQSIVLSLDDSFDDLWKTYKENNTTYIKRNISLLK